MVLPRRAKVQPGAGTAGIARVPQPRSPAQQVTVQAPPVSQVPLQISQVPVGQPQVPESPMHLIWIVQILLQLQVNVTTPPATPERPSLFRWRKVSRFRLSFFNFFFN